MLQVEVADVVKKVERVVGRDHFEALHHEAH